MKQHMFILLFFTGGVPLVLSAFRKYYLIKQATTWSDAQAYCRANHVDLALIQSNDDKVQFQNELQTQNFTSSAWIGLYDDVNSWTWSYRSQPLGSMETWCNGIPYNSGGDAWCVTIHSGGWHDVRCTNIYRFVCFDETKTGDSRYILSSTTKTWDAARSYCRTYYTDLASDRDSIEHSVLISLVGSTNTWIGLHRESWKWTDQSTFSTISWSSGQPDNRYRSEDCGCINNGAAADEQCSNTLPFFCYSVIAGKQQIIKMKVKSDKDVHNPAVMATIMEQFMQKLKDHGIVKDFRVKWKVHPDGNVFQKEKENSTTALNKL